MENVIIALVSVSLGWILAVAKDWMMEKWKKKKEAEYLAIRIVCILDKFVENCANVIADDGSIQGEFPPDKRADEQIPAPDLNFDSIDVNWKSIPQTLMYDLLSFPNDISDADNLIYGPDDADLGDLKRSEFFKERQFQYATLGIKAADLAQKLRFKYEIHARSHNQWNPIKQLKQKKISLLESRIEGIRNFKSPFPILK